MAGWCPLLLTEILCGGVVLLLVADLYLLAVHLGKARREVAGERALLAAQPAQDELPSVCVQLPVFNEPQVAAAIDSLCRLEWPQGRLEILVLDDTTGHPPDPPAPRLPPWRTPPLPTP